MTKPDLNEVPLSELIRVAVWHLSAYYVSRDEVTQRLGVDVSLNMDHWILEKGGDHVTCEACWAGLVLMCTEPQWRQKRGLDARPTDDGSDRLDWTPSREGLAWMAALDSVRAGDIEGALHTQNGSLPDGPVVTELREWIDENLDPEARGSWPNPQQFAALADVLEEHGL